MSWLKRHLHPVPESVVRVATPEDIAQHEVQQSLTERYRKERERLAAEVDYLMDQINGPKRSYDQSIRRVEELLAFLKTERQRLFGP